jgi:hypothetical protein
MMPSASMSSSTVTKMKPNAARPGGGALDVKDSSPSRMI